jgi:hypothetical protein
MTYPKRKSEFSKNGGVEIETYIDGEGPAFVILPSMAAMAATIMTRSLRAWSTQAGGSCARSREAASRVQRVLARAGIDAIAQGARLPELGLRRHQPRLELGAR